MFLVWLSSSINQFRGCENKNYLDTAMQGNLNKYDFSTSL